MSCDFLMLEPGKAPSQENVKSVLCVPCSPSRAPEQPPKCALSAHVSICRMGRAALKAALGAVMGLVGSCKGTRGRAVRH